MRYTFNDMIRVLSDDNEPHAHGWRCIMHGINIRNYSSKYLASQIKNGNECEINNVLNSSLTSARKGPLRLHFDKSIGLFTHRKSHQSDTNRNLSLIESLQ